MIKEKKIIYNKRYIYIYTTYIYNIYIYSWAVSLMSRVRQWSGRLRFNPR